MNELIPKCYIKGVEKNLIAHGELIDEIWNSINSKDILESLLGFGMGFVYAELIQKSGKKVAYPYPRKCPKCHLKEPCFNFAFFQTLKQKFS